ncbi:hypothetical protein [Burkholderia pseudomultivorans]|nr:hypothetical protein [Burkholderia pseudomultivorans]
MTLQIGTACARRARRRVPADRHADCAGVAGRSPRSGMGLFAAHA